MQTTEPRSLVVDALPVAGAIGVFGVIYGATAAAVVGPAMTVASSLLLFSGAAQFTMVGLLDTGAAPVAVAVAVAVLALRHLPLAAIVLPRLDIGRPRRTALALVLIDETAGLAVASHRPAARTMAAVGAAAYGAWVVGTVAGVLGADLVAVAPLAEVVFVILFIGLSALTCRARADVVRAAAAATATAALLVVAPAVGALGAILVAVGCAAAGAGRIDRAAGSGAGHDSRGEARPETETGAQHQTRSEHETGARHETRSECETGAECETGGGTTTRRRS